MGPPEATRTGSSRTIEVPGKREKVGATSGAAASNDAVATTLGRGWALPPPPPPFSSPHAPPYLQTQTLLKDQLELHRVKQPDGSSRYSIKPLETEFSFDKGFFMFIRAIQLLTQHNKDTIVVRVVVGGGSASALRACCCGWLAPAPHSSLAAGGKGRRAS